MKVSQPENRPAPLADEKISTSESQHKNRFVRFLVIVGILGIAVMGATTLVKMKPPPEKKEQENLDLLVQVITLEESAETFFVSSQGTVKPRTETVLSAELSGTITSISDKFVAGGVFGKNEVLMTIDPSNYAIAVDQAKALLTQREIEHVGALRLKEKGYQSDSQVASAAAALASAKASLERARRDLARTKIRLPYSGMVRSKNVDVGQFVNPGMQLGVTFATDYAEVRLPITDIDRAFLELPSPQASAQHNSKSPAVTLTTTREQSSNSWPAYIARTEGVVDENTRVTYAVARVNDPYNFKADPERTPLLMGAFVRAQIAGTTVDSIVKVPRKAVRGGNQLLLVDDEKRLRLETVEILRTDSQYAYLSSGAAAGDLVVTTAIESPINGTRVRVNE